MPPSTGQQSDRSRAAHSSEQSDSPRELLALVYEQLHELARQRMSHERGDHTLQPTALVHEVYLRLFGRKDLASANRAVFYFAAAEAMRRILVEHARARGRQKRGGQARKLSLSVVDLADQGDADDILAVHEAIEKLEAHDADMAQVVRLRFFTGLSVEETAQVLGVSPRTVKRDWALARAWLHDSMQRDIDP